MLISTLVMTGGTVAVGAGVLQKRRQPSKATYWTDYYKKATAPKLTLAKKKKRCSLYDTIQGFNETLQLDTLAPFEGHHTMVDAEDAVALLSFGRAIRFKNVTFSNSGNACLLPLAPCPLPLAPC